MAATRTTGAQRRTRHPDLRIPAEELTSDDSGEGEQAEPSENGEKILTYVPILSVFDRAQTDLTDPTQPDPAKLGHRLTGGDPAGIYDATAD
jgi:hypothetical protein